MTNITGSPFPVTWIGQGPNANGQIIADQTSGPKAKTLVGVAKIKEDATNTAFTIGFIDGTQKIAQYSVVLALQAVTAPATFNGTANVSFYSGIGSFMQIPVGTSIVTAGFATSGNNATLTVLAIASNGFYAVNASAAAETNYSANATYTTGAAVAAVTLSEGNLASDTSTGTLSPTLSTATNALVGGTLSGSGVNGHIKTVLVTVYLAS